MAAQPPNDNRPGEIGLPPPWVPPTGWSTPPSPAGPLSSGVIPGTARDRSGRLMAGMSIAVAILVVAGVLVYVLGNSPSGSPRARLETALIATRSATNADLTIDLKASLGGMSVDLRANGAVDLHPEP